MRHSGSSESLRDADTESVMSSASTATSGVGSEEGAPVRDSPTNITPPQDRRITTLDLFRVKSLEALHEQHDNKKWEKRHIRPAKIYTSKSEINLKSHLNDPLINENIVIIDSTPAKTKGENYQEVVSPSKKVVKWTKSSWNVNESELPEPSTVRKVKDLFESLAKKTAEEKRNNWYQTLPSKGRVGRVPTFRPEKSNLHPMGMDVNKPISRSKSMILPKPPIRDIGCKEGSLSSRRSCFEESFRYSTTSLLPLSSEADSYHHQPNSLYNGGHCSSTYKALTSSLARNPKLPVNVFDGTLEATRNGAGSPVSPDVIRKLHRRGTSMTFFGGQSFLHESESSEDDGDSAFHDQHHDFHKPKVIGVLHKSAESSLSASSLSLSPLPAARCLSPAAPTISDSANDAFSESSSVDHRSTPSPTPSPVQKLPFHKMKLETGYVWLQNSYGYPPTTRSSDVSSVSKSSALQPGMNSKREGNWRKNPFWTGSYFIVYDFTKGSPAVAREPTRVSYA